MEKEAVTALQLAVLLLSGLSDLLREDLSPEDITLLLQVSISYLLRSIDFQILFTCFILWPVCKTFSIRRPAHTHTHAPTCTTHILIINKFTSMCILTYNED